ncbi:hypothetical protein RFX60_05535, partial [Acinetobacter sp. 11520]|nr:hypothetical protein [Acinetobacter sp. 11520]
ELLNISYMLYEHIKPNINSTSKNDLENKKNIIELLIKMFRKIPPIHYSSCQILIDTISDIGADNIIFEEITSYKYSLIQKRKNKII